MSDFLAKTNLFTAGRFNLDPKSGGIRVPEWAFIPDGWSLTLLRGLGKLAHTWSEKCIWEVGVGTGINIAALKYFTLNARWYFSDYNPKCVPLAMENILHVHPEDGTELFPLEGSWDLVTPPKEGNGLPPSVDIIFGCLPQVPAEIDLAVGDRIAHYYHPSNYPEAHLNAIGLGLNEALLKRAKSVLRLPGLVILNLSGRPGIKRLFRLFYEAGYAPWVVHQENVPQHRGTSLATLATLESHGQENFEFFSDSAGNLRINAREAEMRRVAGKEVFHNIYVIAGKLA